MVTVDVAVKEELAAVAAADDNSTIGYNIKKKGAINMKNFKVRKPVNISKISKTAGGWNYGHCGCGCERGAGGGGGGGR